MVTLESVLEYHNMRTAMTQVIKSRGAAGYDGIPVSELEQWLGMRTKSWTKTGSKALCFHTQSD